MIKMRLEDAFDNKLIRKKSMMSKVMGNTNANLAFCFRDKSLNIPENIIEESLVWLINIKKAKIKYNLGSLALWIILVYSSVDDVIGPDYGFSSKHLSLTWWLLQIFSITLVLIS